MTSKSNKSWGFQSRANGVFIPFCKSHWIPVACFAYLAFFAWQVSGILKKRGYDIESINTEGGH